MAGDRALWVGRLTRDLPEEDDLRFVARADTADEVLIAGERLPWDSEFFGYDVARLHGIFPTAAPFDRPEAEWGKPLKKWLARLERRGVRYVFAMVDPRELALLRALGEAKFALIETRYYHHGQVVEPALGQRYPIRRATPDDISSLAEAASETINRYDRFHADPFLDPQRVAGLMRRWIEESVAGRMADVVIVPDVPNPRAFVTYRYQREAWDAWGLALAQGVLSAVAPEFRGWMGKLGPEVAYHLYSQGVRYVTGSTQVTNPAIIWLAQDGGARFGRCEHVFRRVL